MRSDTLRPKPAGAVLWSLRGVWAGLSLGLLVWGLWAHDTYSGPRRPHVVEAFGWGLVVLEFPASVVLAFLLMPVGWLLGGSA